MSCNPTNLILWKIERDKFFNYSRSITVNNIEYCTSTVGLSNGRICGGCGKKLIPDATDLMIADEKYYYSEETRNKYKPYHIECFPDFRQLLIQINK